MKIIKTASDAFWLLMFIAGIIPFFEALVWIAQMEQNIFSQWNVYAIFWGVLVTESEIRFFDYLSQKNWWKERVVKKFEKVFKKRSNNHTFLKKIFRDLEYIGLTFSTSIINLGKIGTVIFVNSKIALPLGRLFLYLGIFFRVIITYYVFTSVSSLAHSIANFLQHGL